jgi:uncharacterized protein (TIGR02466 family)
MNVSPLFSIPLAISTLDRELTKKEADFIIIQDRYKTTGNKTTYKKNILDEPTLFVLRDFIEQELKTYSDSVMCYQDIELYITQSWLNYNDPKEYHHQHYHANSIVSGVFYIAVNPEDKIQFYDRKPKDMLIFNRSSYNQYNSLNWWWPVAVNQLFLFPSNMEHGVPSIEGAEQMRISLSFNTFFRGKVGTKDEATLLELQ